MPTTAGKFANVWTARMPDDFANALDELLCLIEARYAQDLDAVTDAAGMARTCDVERIRRKRNAVLLLLLDRWEAALTLHAPAAAAELRAFVAPLREMLEKPIADVLRPH
jgi:hypothetical protein